MKPFNLTVALLVILSSASYLNAQKLYTWTDEKGVLHITNQPPPKSAKVKDVTTYKEKTPQELDATQLETEKLRQKYKKEEQIERARQAELQAREADERAKEAMQEAQEVYEYNREYVRKLSTTREKRKQFRKKIQRLKNEAEVSQAKAQAAVQQAEEAAQKAQMMATEAEKAQSVPSKPAP